MRPIAILCLYAAVTAAEQAPPPPVANTPAAETVTADDLQNLVVCARRTLPSLSADEIAGVAQSIKHAEAMIALMRSPPPAPAAPAPKKDK